MAHGAGLPPQGHAYPPHEPAQAAADELFDDMDSFVPADGRARPEDYVSALEELEGGEPERRGRVIWIFVLALLLVVAVAMGAVYFYRVFNSGPETGKVPVIAPQKKPVKVKPAEPEQQAPDRQAPVRRKKIYDRILGDGTEQEPARLAPSEEKPLTPPAAPTPGDATPAEPLPLPLPPPPALDGGQGGDASPSNGGKETRTAALPVSPPSATSRPQETSGRDEKQTATGQDRKAGGIAATPVSGGGEADVKKDVKTDVKTAARDSVTPRAATDLPLPPPPPPVGSLDSAGRTDGNRSPAAGAEGRLDADGLARLAARVAGTADKPADATPDRTLGDEGGELQQPMPATAVRRLNPEVRNAGPRAIETATRKTTQDRQKRAANRARTRAERTARSARTRARQKATRGTPAARGEARGSVRPVRQATGGPRSILPPAVAGRGTATMARQGEAPSMAAAGGPRSIVPPPALQPARQPRKVTNFNTASRPQEMAPRRITNVSTARRGTNLAPARQARVAGSPTAPRRQRVAALAPRPPSMAEPTTPRQPREGQGGYLVQLAAYRSRDDALRAYRRLQARHGALLGGMGPRIERKDLGAAGTFYRLAVGPLPSRTAARKLCNALIARGEKDCLVRRR